MNGRGKVFSGVLLFILGIGLSAAEAGEPIVFGVAGPLSGDNAEYGALWRRGFDIALEEINGSGGIAGRRIEVVYEDSRSEPRQAASIAQKFVNDPAILAELGDFTTTATWAASPIYQRGGLIQLAFNPSHPELTKGGDFVFQLCPTQSDQAKALATVTAERLRAGKVAILYLNTDFGKAVRDQVAEQLRAKGIEVVADEGYQPTDKDFKSQLTKVKALEPDVIVLGSYYTDAAIILRQARDLGIKATYIASSSVHSPALFTIGGDAVEGLITLSVFNFANPNPTQRSFFARYRAAHGNEEPNTFVAQAYDAIKLLAAAARRAAAKGGITRRSLRDELAATRDFEAVSQDTITYSPARQLADPQSFPIVARGGDFVPYAE
ncbi:MAG: ABC transporter substrate-binding protein [Planctomycetota bacterium]|jgi:branched-chain amino acid transport system substrate-binding protein|nr:ABC transporter substrate-binding protein [Planctomycetota bacterium]